MKRVTVTNHVTGQLYGPIDMQDPTEWIAAQVSSNSWGLGEREKWEYDCTPAEIASAISSRTDEWGNVYYTIPADYTIVILDVTSEYQAAANAVWVAARNAQCEVDISALLNGREKITIVSFALKSMYIANNRGGTFTQPEVDAAIVDENTYFALMGQIEALMDIRDADIAAYLAANPVNP
jgi:hypothetical protein